MTNEQQTLLQRQEQVKDRFEKETGRTFEYWTLVEMGMLPFKHAWGANRAIISDLRSKERIDHYKFMELFCTMNNIENETKSEIWD